MKKFFKKVGKIFFALAICNLLTFNAAQAETSPEALAAFREAMTKTGMDDRRVFREDMFFIVPSVQSELDFIATTDGPLFRTAGTFDFWLTDDDGNTTNTNVPFYTTQTGRDMTIYFELAKKWYKYQTPSLAALAADIIATPDSGEIDEMISIVQEVTILQETDSRRTLLVQLDGNKIADVLKEESAKNPADKGTANDALLHQKFLEYLDSGLRNSTVWYTWTINKNTWDTITLSFNLSGFIQQTALAALNDDSMSWDNFFKNILETIAYYSETKAYTTYLNDDAAKKLEIPKKVLNAPAVEDMVQSKK